LAAFVETMAATMSQPPPENERQWSVNDFWSCITVTQIAVHCHKPIINVSAALRGKNASDDITITFYS